MKKLLLALLLSACFIGNAFAAELLVRAAPHWMDSLTSEEVAKMTPEAKQSYEARAQKGDPIVVRPDGWNWGKDERDTKLFLIIKAPNMTEAEAKVYEQTLTDNTDPQKPILKRVRKFSIPSTLTAGAVSGTVTTTKATLQSQVITKIGASSEVIQPKSDLLKTGWKKIKPPLMVAYHFWIENAWAATLLEKTIMSSGGDYTSLEACMNGNEQDLVSADKHFDPKIDGTWSSADTTAVTIHNYTTDATRYINIYTTSAAFHNGSRGTGYSISKTSLANLIDIQSNYVTLDGLRLNMVTSSNDNSEEYAIKANANYLYIKRNFIEFFYSTGTLHYGSGIGLMAGKTPIYVYNNFVMDCDRRGVESNNATGSYSWIYNNTVYSCGGHGFFNRGASEGNAQTFKNNLSLSNGTDYGQDSGGTTVWVNNASSDATGNSGFTGYTTANELTDLTAGSENLHLKLGATSIDNALDLSGVAPNFTDDIDGVTRTGTWDIGADEYVAAGGGAGVIKSIWGINFSDIKKINGIDIGDIKQINGLTTQ